MYHSHVTGSVMLGATTNQRFGAARLYSRVVVYSGRGDGFDESAHREPVMIVAQGMAGMAGRALVPHWRTDATHTEGRSKDRSRALGSGARRPPAFAAPDRRIRGVSVAAGGRHPDRVSGDSRCFDELSGSQGDAGRPRGANEWVLGRFLRRRRSFYQLRLHN